MLDWLAAPFISRRQLWLVHFDPPLFHCSGERLFLLLFHSQVVVFFTVGIHALEISILLSLLTLLGWSLTWVASLTLSLGVPVRVSINKLNLIPNLILLPNKCFHDLNSAKTAKRWRCLVYALSYTYRNELGDFHHGMGSISLHFWSLMKSINPCKDLGPSYFLNSPFLTLIKMREKKRWLRLN